MKRYRTLAAIFLSLFSTVWSHASTERGAATLWKDAEKPCITADHVQTIYKHLVEDHYVPDTGLFISFLGTGDHKLSQQASTYDQAAVGLLAIRLGDIERAEGIFRFFKTA